MAHLNDYPSLSRWYHDHNDMYPLYEEDPTEYTAWQFCRALTLEVSEASLLWQSALSRLLDQSENVLSSFQEVERFFECSGVSLTQMISNWGYDSFQIGREDEFFLLMEKTANKTGLVSFYFLAAWSAFNLNEFDACLKICDKVEGCYAPILTLKGQALLESGRSKEAIAVLEDAVTSDEREILAWFQLAKACWLEQQYQGAFDSLLSCLKVSGSNPEVSLFLAIVATDAPYSFAWHQKAWEEMQPFMAQYKANEEYVDKLIKLAIRSNQKDWMEVLAEKVDWQSIKEALYVNKKLGPLLKDLGERTWYELAKKILDQLIGAELTEDGV